MMQTYQGMNERIVGILRMNDDHLYAALRIEELERQLASERQKKLGTQDAADVIIKELQDGRLRIKELEQQLATALGVVEDCNGLNAELVKDREAAQAEAEEALQHAEKALRHIVVQFTDVTHWPTEGIRVAVEHAREIVV